MLTRKGAAPTGEQLPVGRDECEDTHQPIRQALYTSSAWRGCPVRDERLARQPSAWAGERVLLYRCYTVRMTPDTIATILTGIGVLFGVWRLIEGVRRDLTHQIASVNIRIDNVLLADRGRHA